MRPPKTSQKIYQYIRRGMQTGKFRVGEKIPTERNLAAQFKTSRPTVARALRRLVTENLICRNGKGGSTITGLPTRSTVQLGAAFLGLAIHHREQTVIDLVARELNRLAAMENVEIHFEDPSWSEDPGETGDLLAPLAERFRQATGRLA